jgi:hypothetical protein
VSNKSVHCSVRSVYSKVCSVLKFYENIISRWRIFVDIFGLRKSIQFQVMASHLFLWLALTKMTPFYPRKLGCARVLYDFLPIKLHYKLRKISCYFLLLGGNMILRYGLQCLCSENSQNCKIANSSAIMVAREK